jgi:hypothetical protein
MPSKVFIGRSRAINDLAECWLARDGVNSSDPERYKRAFQAYINQLNLFPSESLEILYKRDLCAFGSEVILLPSLDGARSFEQRKSRPVCPRARV